MSRNINQKLVGADGTDTVLTLVAGASGVLDMDLDTVANLQVLISVTYTQTASTTGVSVYLKGGFGGDDTSITQSPLPYAAAVGADATGSSVPVFGDNREVVTMANVPASWGAPVTVRTNFYLSDIGIKLPRWVRLEFVNTDNTNTATIQVKLDM